MFYAAEKRGQVLWHANYSSSLNGNDDDDIDGDGGENDNEIIPNGIF